MPAKAASLTALIVAAFGLSPLPAAANPALDGYADHAQFTQQIEQLDQSSDAVAARSLGKSAGQRDVWLLTVGLEQADEKPAIAVIGSTHGPHLAGAELAIRMARQLAALAATDEATKKLLASHTFYFIPRPSPDVCEKCFGRPFRERAGNDRPTDDDRDFAVGEDAPDDLNGDGWITMMRVADASGEWMPHPDEPRVLIQADRAKNERGQYLLLVEGKDDDGDGQWNEDGGEGVAFDRNFTFRYEPFAKGTGPNAVSEPEHRAVADFLHDRPNIAAVFSFSPEDNLFHPWKPDQKAEEARLKTKVLSADAPILDFLAEAYKKIHGGSDAPPSPEGRGSFTQWAYFHYGRWSLATRGWWIPQVDPAQPLKDKRAADELNALRWLEREQLDGFANWAPIEHPDFPGKQVEVGGFKPFFRLNPPAKELDGLAQKHWQFVAALSEQLPRLTIARAKAEPLGGGVVRIEATLANQGYMPTLSDMGRINGEAYPAWIEVVVPDKTNFLQGHARTRLTRLEGAGGKTERTWLVRFRDEPPKTIEIKAFAPAVGSVSQTLEIK